MVFPYTSPPETEIDYTLVLLRAHILTHMTNRILPQAVLQAEDEIRNERVEIAKVFDTEGNLVFEKRSSREDSIIFSFDETRLMLGKIFTHNHPFPAGTTQSDSFSPEDIELAATMKLLEIRAVTPTVTFSMRPPADGWNSEYWERRIKPALLRVRSIVYQADQYNIETGKLTYHEAMQDYWDRVWRKTAQLLGMIYERSEVERTQETTHPGLTAVEQDALPSNDGSIELRRPTTCRATVAGAMPLGECKDPDALTVFAVSRTLLAYGIGSNESSYQMRLGYLIQKIPEGFIVTSSTDWREVFSLRNGNISYSLKPQDRSTFEYAEQQIKRVLKEKAIGDLER
jgi:hypothetical protein